MNPYRSHFCNELNVSHLGQTVTLSGWVHTKRDHGSLVFIDLRDRFGITQAVAHASDPFFKELNDISLESVIKITGKVIARREGTINPKLPTGEIELAVEGLEILSQAEMLPYAIHGDNLSDELCLTYRYLDLRRDEMKRRMILRSDVIQFLRTKMLDLGFQEFQTPILTASSPEGARDFVVPSRHFPGKFYALPQAPQIFKQLIMMAGFDRYFQIAPCFRNEDARADRSPGEFYQLDFEMSFVTQEEVFQTLEEVLHELFVRFADGRKVSPLPFKQLTYKEAMERYGIDKPDLRSKLSWVTVSNIFAQSSFKVFRGMVEKGAVVRAIVAPGAGKRSFCDSMNNFARKQGAPGLGFLFFSEGKGMGPIANNLSEELLQDLKVQLNLAQHSDEELNDLAIFFICDQYESSHRLAHLVRTELNHKLELCDPNSFEFCWVKDFPMFERDEASGKLDFSHNPFSMPQGGLNALNEQDPLTILAYQYDIICNGYELSSGAIRNHQPETLYKAFDLVGYSREEVDQNFSGMLQALKFGAPPHGGSAPGIERIVMLLSGVDNIREVTLFPLTQRGEDLMLKAPTELKPDQLEELGLAILPQED